MMCKKKKPSKDKSKKTPKNDLSIALIDTYDPRFVDPITKEFYEKERR